MILGLQAVVVVRGLKHGYGSSRALFRFVPATGIATAPDSPGERGVA